MRRFYFGLFIITFSSCRSETKTNEAYIELNKKLDSVNRLFKQPDTIDITTLDFDSIVINSKPGDSLPINAVIESFDKKSPHQQKQNSKTKKYAD